MNPKDLPLLLEIARDPSDCLLNHRVSKPALKRLMSHDLIEVETRRISTWSTPQIGVARPSVYGVWNPHAAWKDRTEIHARLTQTGHAWIAEFRTVRNGV